MIKTSTKNNAIIEQKNDEVSETIQNDLFYDSIKKPLNNLMRNPEETTIQNILDFSKKLA